MKFLIKGLDSASDVLKLFKAADDAVLPVRVLADDGTPINVTSTTVTLECYDNVSRNTAAVKSFSTTITTALAGEVALTPTVATVNVGPGTFYMFAKSVDAGTNVTISSNHIKLKVG